MPTLDLKVVSCKERISCRESDDGVAPVQTGVSLGSGWNTLHVCGKLKPGNGSTSRLPPSQQHRGVSDATLERGACLSGVFSDQDGSHGVTFHTVCLTGDCVFSLAVLHLTVGTWSWIFWAVIWFLKPSEKVQVDYFQFHHCGFPGGS